MLCDLQTTTSHNSRLLNFKEEEVVIKNRRSFSSNEGDAKRKPSFISSVVENIRTEMARNKDMKESLNHFREEARKLEETEALKKARAKYDSVERETRSSLHSVKESLSHLSDAEAVKKTREKTQQVLKTTLEAAESFATKTAETEAAKSLGSLVDDGLYVKPSKLRKRKDFVTQRSFDINESESRVQVHKESLWSQSWSDLRAKSPIFDRLTNWRQSDSPVLRAASSLTERVSDLFGSLFQKNELSAVLTEIVKVDANFDKNDFCDWLQKEAIPNVLEAIAVGDLEVMSDWMHEACFSIISQPIKAAASAGQVIRSRILDVSSVDISFGKIVPDSGPLLVITFLSQQTKPVVFDEITGKRIYTSKEEEGDEDVIIRVNHVWVVCRDQSELDPKAAWKILEMASSSSQQFM